MWTRMLVCVWIRVWVQVCVCVRGAGWCHTHTHTHTHIHLWPKKIIDTTRVVILRASPMIAHVNAPNLEIVTV